MPTDTTRWAAIPSVRLDADAQADLETIQAAHLDPLGNPLTPTDAIRLAIRNEAGRIRGARNGRKKRGREI